MECMDSFKAAILIEPNLLKWLWSWKKQQVKVKSRNRTKSDSNPDATIKVATTKHEFAGKLAHNL